MNRVNSLHSFEPFEQKRLHHQRNYFVEPRVKKGNHSKGSQIHGEDLPNTRLPQHPACTDLAPSAHHQALASRVAGDKHLELSARRGAWAAVLEKHKFQIRVSSC